MVNVYASWWYLLSDHNYINQCFFLTFLHHLPFLGDKLLLKLINCWRNISAGIVRFWWSLCYLSFSKGITKTECHRKTCFCSKRRVFKAMLLKPQFQEEFQMTRLFKLKKICAFFIRQGGSSCVALPPALFHTIVAIISIVAANSHEIDAIKIFAKLFSTLCHNRAHTTKGLFPFCAQRVIGFWASSQWDEVSAFIGIIL